MSSIRGRLNLHNVPKMDLNWPGKEEQGKKGWRVKDSPFPPFLEDPFSFEIGFSAPRDVIR